MDYLDNSFYEYEKAGIDSLTIYEYDSYYDDTSKFVKFYFEEDDVSRMKYDFQKELPIEWGNDSGVIHENYYELNKEGNLYNIDVPVRFSSTGTLTGYMPGFRSETTTAYYVNALVKSRLIAEETIIDSVIYLHLVKYYEYYVSHQNYIDTLYFKESDSFFRNGVLKSKTWFDYHQDSLKPHNIVEDFPKKDYLPFWKSLFGPNSIEKSPSKFIENEFPIDASKNFLLIVYNSKENVGSLEKLKRKYRKKMDEEFTVYYSDFNTKDPIPADQFELDYTKHSDSIIFHGLVNTKGEKMKAIVDFDEVKIKNDFIGFIFDSEYEYIFRLDSVADFERFFNSELSKHYAK